MSKPSTKRSTAADESCLDVLRLRRKITELISQEMADDDLPSAIVALSACISAYAIVAEAVVESAVDYEVKEFLASHGLELARLAVTVCETQRLKVLRDTGTPDRLAVLVRLPSNQVH